jgi:phosphoribosylformylglycinamidine cyclo-ligase
MPGFYADGEYDVAGFVVGMVDRVKRSTADRSGGGRALRARERGLAHQRLFSRAEDLLRRAGKTPNDTVDGLPVTIGDALLAEHRSYLKPLRGAVDLGLIRGLAHITGGGLTDNLPRILPEGWPRASIAGPGRVLRSSR